MSFDEFVHLEAAVRRFKLYKPIVVQMESLERSLDRVGDNYRSEHAFGES